MPISELQRLTPASSKGVPLHAWRAARGSTYNPKEREAWSKEQMRLDALRGDRDKKMLINK